MNGSFEAAASPTRCLVSFASERTKREGVSGRDGSKRHTSEKRGGGLVKTLPFPRHRVFVGGRDPGGGRWGGWEDSFQVSDVLVVSY